MLVNLVLLSASFMQEPLSDPTRGAYLYKSCSVDLQLIGKAQPSEHDIDWASHCIDYMKGFIDATGSLEALCFGNAKFGEIVRVYVSYMENHPKLMEESRSTGAMLALVEGFPCPAKTARSR